MEALVSDIVIVPPTLSSLTGKQLLFLSSDAGHLIRVSVDLTSTNEASKPSAQFRHVTIPRNPILLMASLGKFENKDIIALFGDLCEGEIAMVHELRCFTSLKVISN